MSFEFLNSVNTFLIQMLAILFAISIHEFGHAYVAHLNGDDTARLSGRMDINPLAHIDIFGMLMMFLTGFGWAKPVPVNPNNYKRYKLGNITVSLAGIFFNLLSAVVFLTLARHIHNQLFIEISMYIVSFNIGFASFNILPIPPLDGWSFISTFMSREVQYKAYQYARYTFVLFIILMLTNLFTYILSPIYTVFSTIVNFLAF